MTELATIAKDRIWMLKIKIITVGKLKERALRELAGEYVKRLGRYCSLEIAEVAEEDIPAGESEAGIAHSLKNEAERLLGRIGKADAHVIALDMRGEAPDSVALSRKIVALAGTRPEIAFIIGGSCGLHPDVLKRADMALSISNLTLPHQLARLILLEQVYRAFKIQNNEAYHK